MNGDLYASVVLLTVRICYHHMCISITRFFFQGQKNFADLERKCLLRGQSISWALFSALLEQWNDIIDGLRWNPCAVARIPRTLLPNHEHSIFCGVRTFCVRLCFIIWSRQYIPGCRSLFCLDLCWNTYFDQPDIITQISLRRCQHWMVVVYQARMHSLYVHHPCSPIPIL